MPWVATTTEDAGAGWQPAPELLEVLAASQQVGAIGPGPLAGHVAHAAGFLEAANAAALDHDGVPLPPRLRVLDLGSGGGLPGLVLGALLPKARCTLLDGRTERVRLLSEHLTRLGWVGRVEACACRAEQAGRDERHRGAYDLVVARGFAGPAVTAECGAPFLRPGGLLVVSEPPGAPPRWPREELSLLSLQPLGGLRTVLSAGASGAGYQVLLQVETCAERFPRRTGIPAKRPLF